MSSTSPGAATRVPATSSGRAVAVASLPETLSAGRNLNRAAGTIALPVLTGIAAIGVAGVALHTYGVSRTVPSPYCGSPPTIATLAGRWNLDPFLIAALVAGASIYAAVFQRRLSAQPRWFAIGWALTAAALISPLCALSVSLFAARVGQHMVLTLLAAPLVALGLPLTRRRMAGQEAWAAAGFALALWAWHAPAPYGATFLSGTVYWSMHVTTWAAAVFFWWTVLRAPVERRGAATIATIATGFQMALLGAIITWAPSPLYWPHFVTPYQWGLTPLADQQLGGVLMWVPGSVIFLAAVVVPLTMLLRRSAPRLTLHAG